MKCNYLTQRQSHVMMLHACGMRPKDVCKYTGLTRGSYENAMAFAKQKLKFFGVTITLSSGCDKRGRRIIAMEHATKLKETGFDAAKKLAAEAGLIQT